ncbi:MAG: YggS family pyridoxal phosphate-dependent enzyme [Flammeovirgaceae bacterium]|nr:YggS family pyridoxal phosphate-dependent enzyme [Flammeovirgaceae bacterium]
MDIKNNIQKLQTELESKGCILVAVSKTHPPELILEAYTSGHKVFGENKVQELVSKYEALPKDIEWHLIGHLQRNKVKYIAPFVTLIHAIDSVKLLEEVNKQGAKINRVIHCLLQVHIAQEETKFGFDPAEVLKIIRTGGIGSMPYVKIKGLMAMATLTDKTDIIASEFKSVQELITTLRKEKLPTNVEMKELSIGMSSDYKIALDYGSTMVRVGTAIFGERKYD